MSAVISPCGRYRYTLGRKFPPPGGGHHRVVAFIGVNPSTADAETDDATVRKWRGFAIRWGFTQLLVGNLFAWRATDVRELARVDDPVGPDNDAHLAWLMERVDLLVPCWGSLEKVPGWKAKQMLRDRAGAVRAMIRGTGKPVKVLGLTQHGDPKHPLMLGYDTQLRDWQP